MLRDGNPYIFEPVGFFLRDNVLLQDHVHFVFLVAAPAAHAYDFALGVSKAECIILDIVDMDA